MQSPTSSELILCLVSRLKNALCKQATVNTQTPGVGPFVEPSLLEALKMGYTQITSELRHAEQQEHQVTIATSSLLLLVTGSTLGATKLPNSSLYAVAGFCLIFAFLACWYLRHNGTLSMTLYRDLIRIEELLGFHTADRYATQSMVELWGDGTPFTEHKVFADEGLRWAKRKVMHSTWPHLLAVAITGIACGGVILTKILGAT